MDLTHASFFSGVGGMDRGLEAAGWRTVSFSEIEPYACKVLAERWPGIPNLGDIVQLAGGERGGLEPVAGDGAGRVCEPDDWRTATLWSGGFPCQDLSVAGKRRGMGDGTRSGLAFAFLDLVRVHRPPLILLENVPGLLSSHGGRDMARLFGTMVELGYGVGYRILDARYFGVPQRRRRVFIVGIKADGRVGAERAAEVLSVGSRCTRHPPTGIKAGPGIAPSLTRSFGATGGHDGIDDRHHGYSSCPSPDPHGMREADGLARGTYDPPKYDTARYRVCGNGVVAPVAEWLGWRLREEAERL